WILFFGSIALSSFFTMLFYGWITKNQDILDGYTVITVSAFFILGPVSPCLIAYGIFLYKLRSKYGEQLDTETGTNSWDGLVEERARNAQRALVDLPRIPPIVPICPPLG